MAREINGKQQFTDKLVKFIPTEIIGAYMALAGFLGYNPVSSTSTLDKMAVILIQVVFFILLVMTPIYLWKIGNVKHKVQLGVATVSFAVWVYTLGSPFYVWKLYHPYISCVLLVLWSLIPPLFIKVDTSTDTTPSV
jgi:hypothetical protein